jgi:hypothetical protein
MSDMACSEQETEIQPKITLRLKYGIWLLPELRMPGAAKQAGSEAAQTNAAPCYS